jgi:uncharacterized protein YjbJ (UPF0337 family)
MNRDRLQGIWKQLRGKMRVGRAKLTNDQLSAIDGRREICAGRLQEAYGIGKDAAARRTNAWRKTTPVVATDRDTGLYRVDARR